MAESLLADHAEAVVMKAVSMALDGDPAALKLVIERILPPLKDRPISIEMKRIRKASDAAAAKRAILEAAARGEIDAETATSLQSLIDSTALSIESRQDRLEEEETAEIWGKKGAILD